MHVEDYVKSFARHLINTDIPETIEINRQEFVIDPGVKESINNQGGSLQEENLLGRSLEYTITSENLHIPMSIQLYETGQEYFRLFSFSNKGLLFSINLSTEYDGGIVELQQQLKLSTRGLSIEERSRNREKLVLALENEGFKIDRKYVVNLGKYDVFADKFVDTTSSKFVIGFIKVALIKGHFAKNKGYEISSLK